MALFESYERRIEKIEFRPVSVRHLQRGGVPGVSARLPGFDPYEIVQGHPAHLL